LHCLQIYPVHQW